LEETAREQAALAELRRAPAAGALAAMAAAERELAAPASAGADLRARAHELAEALFQSIHMQLSVPRYRAISVGRGANLDLIDTPLNNGPWLRERFAALRALPGEAERLRGIAGLLDWENPGPGGFYDDLGSQTAQPHLVAGSDYADDPAMLRAPHLASGGPRGGPALRISSRTYAESRDDQPLEMVYRGLDPTARYRVRVVYGMGDLGSREKPMAIRLVANGSREIHGFRPKDPTGQPVEFDVPADATRGGELRLTWSRPKGLGGNGRGVQVAEVWLIRAEAP
jgi:hypothetical protein